MSELHLSGGHLWPKHLRVMVSAPAKGLNPDFAMTFPAPLFAIAANDTWLAGSYNMPYVKVNSEMDLAFVRSLLETGRFESLVIDSADELQRKLLVERMAKKGKNTLDYEDWGWIEQKLNRVFEALTSMPIHILVNCRYNEEQNRPMLSGKFAEQIHNYFDYALTATRTQDIEQFLDALLNIEPDESGEITTEAAAKLEEKSYVGMNPTMGWTHSIVDFDESFVLADFETMWQLHNEGASEESPEVTTVEIADHEQALEILNEIF